MNPLKAETAAHTPTPWKVRKPGTGLYEYPIITDETGHISIVSLRQGNQDNNANAAYIVRAVNSHEALLEACKEAAKTKIGWSSEEIDRVQALLDRAIAQAEGK